MKKSLTIIGLIALLATAAINNVLAATTASNKNFVLKSSNSPHIYLIVGNKRSRILNAGVLFDYGLKWSDIKIVDDEKLQKHPFAKLVKTSDSPNVYYIDETINKKRLIPSEKIFLSYNFNWGDIAVINKKDLDSYGNIRVIKSVKNSKVYELKNGKKIPISTQKKFLDAGYRWGEILTVNDTELDYYQTIAAENNTDGLTDNTDINSSAVNITANRYLTVKTVKSSSEAVAVSGSIITLMQLQLTSGLDKSANINSFTIARTKGISSIDEIDIIDAKGNLLGKKEISSENKITISLNPEIIIGPNLSKTINIKVITKKMDFTVYEQLLIESKSDIGTTANIEGSFPVAGDRFKVFPGNIIGQLEVSGVTISENPVDVSIGVTDQLITKFKFRETSGKENVYLKKLKITNLGATDAQFSNIDLVGPNNKAIVTVAKPDGKYIIFDLSKTPYLIKKGSSVILSVRADINDGVGAIISFVIEDKADISAQGAEYLFELTSTSSDSNYPIGHGNANIISIKEIRAAVNKDKTSPNSDLVIGSKAQTLGIFNISIENVALNLQAITLQAINEKSGAKLSGDLLIKDKNKKIIGQSSAELAANQPRQISLNDLYKIEPKKGFSFNVLADVSDKATILDTYRIKITGLDFKSINGIASYSFSFSEYGNTLGIIYTTLNVNSDSKAKNQEIVAGNTKVLIGSFVLQAGIAEDIVVNGFNIREGSDFAKIDFGSGYSNLKITTGGGETTYPNPNGGPFSPSKPITVKSGKTSAVKIYVDTTTAVNTNKVKLIINNINVTGKTGSSPAIIGDGTFSFETTFKISKLTVAKNSEMSDVTINHDGTSQKIASFSFTNEGPAIINVKSFILTPSDGSAEISSRNGYTKLKASKGGTVNYPLIDGNRFGGFSVKAGEKINIDVYIIPDSTTAGDVFNLVIKEVKSDINVEINAVPTVGQTVTVSQ